MKKEENIKQWLQNLYVWTDEKELEETTKILCKLEPEAKHILTYFQETGKLLPLEGDFPSPEMIRNAQRNITDVAIICIYDALLKFDLKKPK